MADAPARARPDGPDAATLAWVARETGADVARWQRLSGGIATATHLLSLRDGRRVVLRRPKRRWLAGSAAAEQINGEAATLVHVEGRGLLAPRLIAADVDGGLTGRPALLLERLPGRIDLAPRDPASWTDQMANALARIHAQPPVPHAPIPRRLDPASHPEPAPPEWSRRPHRWAEAIDLLWHRTPDGPPTAPTAPTTLVHGDFQHFNLLWTRGRLSGVVDWSPPPAEPLDSDLGHCRLNLVILYGSEVADDFLARYEALTARTVDPWWDLFETVIFLPTWAPTIRRQVGSRIPLDVDALHRRVDDHLPAVLRRAQSTIDG